MPLHDHSGTSSVEFALVLPLLLILLLGAVETGMLILSYAGMNTMMSLVQDGAKNAVSSADVQLRLDAISRLRLGFGFTQVSFDPVVQYCVCPQDATAALGRRSACTLVCDGGAEALRIFEVTGRVTVPSLIPSDAGGGTQTVEAKLTILGQ